MVDVMPSGYDTISDDMKDMTLTNRQARRFLLSYQDLYPPRKLQGREGILSYIRKAGCIQYDPLHVAGHNSVGLMVASMAGQNSLSREDIDELYAILRKAEKEVGQ